MKLQLVITADSTDEIQAILAKINDDSGDDDLRGRGMTVTTGLNPARDAAYGIPANATVATAANGTFTVTPAAQPAAPHLQPVQPQPAQPSAFGELDITGLPWDERIHAGTKLKTEKGVWKKRKSVQELQFNEVEHELRAKMAAVPAAPIQVMADPAAMFGPQAAPQPVAQPAPQNMQPVQALPPIDPRIIAPAAVQPQPQPQPAPQPMQPAQDFQALTNIITQLFTLQTIDPAYMQSLNGRLGVVAITDISQNQERINAAFEMMRQDGKIA